MTMSEAAEADEAVSYPRAADLALIPFDVDPTTGRGQFELTPSLARPDAALYGGTGAAITVMAMEAATQRDALWIVTQFVAQAHVGERIDVKGIDPRLTPNLPVTIEVGTTGITSLPLEFCAVPR